MTSIQVVTPYLGVEWALQDMLVSFGESDIPVLIIDNSPDSDLTPRPWYMPPNVTIETFPQNIGVSASWNKGLAKSADQTLIVSQWVRFSPAEFQQRPLSWGLNHVARMMGAFANEYGMTFGDQGYHCISIGRETVNRIGYFDENFKVFGNDDDDSHRIE